VGGFSWVVIIIPYPGYITCYLSLEYATNIMETVIASSYLRFVPQPCNSPVLDSNMYSFLSLTLSKCCFVRQEVMDLVHKSGKFTKKFEKFTGT